MDWNIPSLPTQLALQRIGCAEVDHVVIAFPAKFLSSVVKANQCHVKHLAAKLLLGVEK